MEVEVHDDPRDPQRKILAFFDTTEVHDLRRMLDDRGRFHELIGRSDAMTAVFDQNYREGDTPISGFVGIGTWAERVVMPQAAVVYWA